MITKVMNQMNTLNFTYGAHDSFIMLIDAAISHSDRFLSNELKISPPLLRPESSTH